MNLGLSDSEIENGEIILSNVKKKKKKYGKRQVFNMPKANAIDFKGERQIFNWLEKIAAKLCL